MSVGCSSVDVIDDVPYLLEYGRHLKVTDPTEIRQGTGVWFSEDGQLLIDLDGMPAAAPDHEADGGHGRRWASTSAGAGQTASVEDLCPLKGLIGNY